VKNPGGKDVSAVPTAFDDLDTSHALSMTKHNVFCLDPPHQLRWSAPSAGGELWRSDSPPIGARLLRMTNRWD
jgi:hypothetical protein